MRPRRKGETGIIGTLVAIVSLVVLIPLSPFIAALWVIDRIRGGDRAARTMDRFDTSQTAEPEEGPAER